jgi:hypothetical protein
LRCAADAAAKAPLTACRWAGVNIPVPDCQVTQIRSRVGLGTWYQCRRHISRAEPMTASQPATGHVRLPVPGRLRSFAGPFPAPYGKEAGAIFPSIA